MGGILKAVAPGKTAMRDLTLLPPTLLVVSGSVSLVFQTLWVRQISLIVGVSVEAIGLAVAAFFAGLGLGSLVFGRLADHRKHPLRLYAALEVAAAAFGMLTTMLLAFYAKPFAQIETVSPALAWASLFLLIGLPAVLMGGTVPAMVAVSGGSGPDTGRSGLLYAANTFGAVLGTLVASFVLMPEFGVRGTAMSAASLGLAAGLLAVLAGSPDRPTRRPVPATGVTRQTILPLAIYMLVGALALGYEVVWAQTVVQFTSTRAYAFSVTLAVYLFGIAIGSAAYPRLSSRIRDPWASFGLLAGAAGFLAMFQIAVLGPWIVTLQTAAEFAVHSVTGSHLAGMCARFAVASAAVILGPTLLLGAAFPAFLNALPVGDRPAATVGAALAANTVGGIFGSVVTGFLLVPAFGAVRTIGILAAVGAVIGVGCAIKSHRQLRVASISVLIGTAVIAVTLPRSHLASLLPGMRSGTLISYEESRGGAVAVVEQGNAKQRFRRLYIQGVSNSGDAMPSLRYMRLQALLPLIVHGGDPKSALVIGLGTGITAGAMLAYEGLDRRVVAELLPAVQRSAHAFHGNFGAASTPRLDVRLRDGRRELLAHTNTYDLITLEPPPPSAAGVAGLYSSNFYELAKTRLNEQGLFAQWLPLPTQNDEDTRSLVRSFIDVFPHTSLWTTELHETLLVGSVQPLVLDAERMARRFTEPAVSTALREVGIGSAEALAATWLMDRSGLEAYAGDVSPVTDDRPSIEFADWVRADELQRTLPQLIALRTAPPLVNADDRFIRNMGVEQRRLLVFYQASLNAYAGHRDRWASDMERVLAGAGADNAYYAWFGGNGAR